VDLQALVLPLDIEESALEQFRKIVADLSFIQDLT
jgi:hypothetical protein